MEGKHIYLPPGGGGGGTALYKPHRYVPLQMVGFLLRSSLKKGIDFGHFDLEMGMVSGETTGEYKRICCYNSK